MKKLILVVISMLLAFSCAFNSGDTGRIVVSLPSVEKSLADHSIDYGKTYLKLWILQDGIPLAFFGKAGILLTPPLKKEVVFDLPANEGTSAPTYQAVVAFHEELNYPADDKIFHEDAYGISDPFYISAGVDTAIPIKLKASPFTVLSDTAGSSVAAVAKESVDDLYRLSDQTLYENSVGTELSLSGSASAYSVSKGVWFNSDDTGFVEEAWLNTSKGIYRKVDGTWTPMMKEADQTAVKHSAAVHLQFVADQKDNLVVFYMNAGLDVGGTASLDSSLARTTDFSAWPWYKAATYVNDPQFAAFSSYTSKIKGDVLGSYVIRDNFILAVTPLGAVRVGDDLMEAIKAAKANNELIDANWVISNILTATKYFLSISGQLILNVASAGDYTFAGTESGVYYSTIERTYGSLTEGGFGSAPVEGTKNKKVLAVSSAELGDNVFTAAAFSDGSLAIIKNTGLWKPIYTTYSGVAANPKSVLWQRQAGSLNLVIVGDDVVQISGVK